MCALHGLQRRFHRFPEGDGGGGAGLSHGQRCCHGGPAQRGAGSVSPQDAREKIAGKRPLLRRYAGAFRFRIGRNLSKDNK